MAAAPDLKSTSAQAATSNFAGFKILTPNEIDSLRPLIDTICQATDRITNRWYNLYAQHLGDDCALSKVSFYGLFATAIPDTLTALKCSGVEHYARAISQLGTTLAERRIPFPEVIAGLHFYTEATLGEVSDAVYESELNRELFSKLAHLRVMLLSDAYFRTTFAVADARINGLELEAARLPSAARSFFRGLVGASPQMRELYGRIERSAGSNGTILIAGESGTGKELVARAIHSSGISSQSPFLALNSAAIPRDLIESELFGYRRGAFSGASEDYPGMFRAAEGGTLFLDEVTEMSLDTQGKLLRALQERKVRPIGSAEEVPVNIRLIASTNRNPEQAVKSGVLRKDLYYRLQARTIPVPPLRERVSDLPALVSHFIALFSNYPRPVPLTGIEADALALMKRYTWPGNVRELSNVVENAYTFGQTGTIRVTDLPASVREGRNGLEDSVLNMAPGSPAESFDEVERDLIIRALETTRGNKVRAAQLLKISRKRLYSRLAKYQLA
jgi:two-component system response regulator AtoC